MSAAQDDRITTAELRRRVRAAEELRLQTYEMAAADVLSTRKAAEKAELAKKQADLAASEAAAAALRLFDDAALVAELTELPTESLQRAAKPVTAHRAAEIIADLRTRAARPRKPRRSRAASVSSTEPVLGEHLDVPL